MKDFFTVLIPQLKVSEWSKKRLLGCAIAAIILIFLWILLNSPVITSYVEQHGETTRLEMTHQHEIEQKKNPQETLASHSCGLEK